MLRGNCPQDVDWKGQIFALNYCTLKANQTGRRHQYAWLKSIHFWCSINNELLSKLYSRSILPRSGDLTEQGREITPRAIWSDKLPILPISDHILIPQPNPLQTLTLRLYDSKPVLQILSVWNWIYISSPIGFEISEVTDSCKCCWPWFKYWLFLFLSIDGTDLTNLIVLKLICNLVQI